MENRSRNRGKSPLPPNTNINIGNVATVLWWIERRKDKEKDKAKRKEKIGIARSWTAL